MNTEDNKAEKVEQQQIDSEIASITSSTSGIVKWSHFPTPTIVTTVESADLISGGSSDPLSHNIGESNYSKHKIQPYHIWEEYNLNPWDADIIKRVLRTKKVKGMTKRKARIMDYEKIIHICQYRLSKLKDNE